VRIETRFIDNADGVGFLYVRIYPDTISISSFEPGLTQDEITAGQAYWNLVWAAGVRFSVSRFPSEQRSLRQ
jgi:hypothetical protein